MPHPFHRRCRSLVSTLALCVTTSAAPAYADELWVAPTAQTDFGGVGIGSNAVWPVTTVGAVRLAWAVPNDLATFQSAKLVLIPHAPGGAATLNVIVCAAQHNQLVGTCTGPFSHAFTGIANQLTEVDVSAAIAPRIGAAGLNHLAVLAYTTATTATDHVVGLRFSYEAALPAGVATLAANTFSGTQTAAAFVGDGAGLTNVTPGVNTVAANQIVDESLTASDLGSDSVTASELAPNSVGSSEVAFNYAASTAEGGPAVDLVCVGCVAPSEVNFSFATLAANTFTASQTINTGNLNLSTSTATSGNVTKNGARFLHNFGSDNTFLGLNAGNTAMTGSRNTASGRDALLNIGLGGSNTASGYQVMYSNSEGSWNTATGYQALFANTTGDYNTASGYRALYSNLGGSGSQGSFNTATGYLALYLNTAGDYNTASGPEALRNNTTGSNNTASGPQALRNNTAGSNNTATGRQALFSNTTGGDNTASGYQALVGNTTGSDNVAVGRAAGANATTGSNNIYLGAGVLAGTANEVDTVRVGRLGGHSRAFIAGVRGVTTPGPAIPVLIDPLGQLGTVSSSRRYKEDIQTMADTSRRLLELRPVTFRYKQPYRDGSKPVQFGLIAEEVADTFPELVVSDAEGRPETVHYETLNILLLNELQMQQKRIAELEQRLVKMERRTE